MSEIEMELPEEIEAKVDGARVIVTSEGIVFSGSLPILSDPVEELTDALGYINELRAALSAYESECMCRVRGEGRCERCVKAKVVLGG